MILQVNYLSNALLPTAYDGLERDSMSKMFLQM